MREHTSLVVALELDDDAKLLEDEVVLDTELELLVLAGLLPDEEQPFNARAVIMTTPTVPARFTRGTRLPISIFIQLPTRLLK